MTSRHFSERTSRTESRRSTVRRGIKKRGILPSFGDIILPVVSVAAVILLIIAGRQFFLNGLRTSPGISSTRAFAESPALLAERERRENPEPAQEIIITDSQDIAASDTNLLAVPGVRETSTPSPVTVEVTPVPEPVKPEPVPAKPAVTPAKKPAPAPAKPATPPKISNLPTSKQWRVQVGAYGSKSSAQEAANKINKAGYKATVYSNPASKYIKVWVFAGADKKSAEHVMNAMKAMGFKTSFVFPPPKSK
ncbi:MAG: SPOR domain-containing protein [Synergistaceae bacterium]|nr:SPOR domain-containing protein [Synergistaceae bacterium]